MISLKENREVEGIKGWWWPDCDQQTWDIIKNDWENSHKGTIFYLFDKTQRPMNTVIQAGGNCGMYPRLLAGMFKIVYTYEPDPMNFVALVLNCPQSNIIKWQAALGSTSDMISMVHKTFENVGMHQVKIDPAGKIPQIPLDMLQFDELQLLMLDIEEYEINALRGAAQTIKNHQPFILCENPTTTVCDYLTYLGYKQIGSSMHDGVFVPNQYLDCFAELDSVRK